MTIRKWFFLLKASLTALEIMFMNHHCHCVQSLASPESVVSCTTAGYICMAEPGCQTALTYYHTNCRAMFEGGSALALLHAGITCYLDAGRKCSRRCRNSLEILMKQDQAKKVQVEK